MAKSILHVCQMDKFIPPFVDFVNQVYGTKDHEFWVFGRKVNLNEVDGNNVVRSFGGVKQLLYYVLLVLKLHRSQKIILHGLFNIRIVFMLFFMPWLLRKCYWVVWGGDLYFYEVEKKKVYLKLKEYFRANVIKSIGNFVVFIKGDYELLEKWYHVSGICHACIMYPSNLPTLTQIKPLIKARNKASKLNILVGNSASPTNNHIEIFNLIEGSSIRSFEMIVPLSYGLVNYRDSIVKEGELRFGKRFKALIDFLPIGEYLDIIDGIDIAIFNHSRQQGVGNTITLLAAGKTVYMQTGVSQWVFFEGLGVVLHDVSIGNFKVQDYSVTLNNRNRIIEYFSKDNYKRQLDLLFS
jgi:dTDP-N-acetylfucosamine:lipid II N-acetylfucosaminyltransferase